jgi:hypothetical protein
MGFDRVVCGIWSLSFVLMLGDAHASAFEVTVDTTWLSGSPAVFVFDFIDGGPPDNTLDLSALSSDGVQGTTSTTGNVSASGPWEFSDAGGSFFNELQVPFDPTGSSLSFSFTTTDHPPVAGSLPDAFSFYILDLDLVTPLISTNDPSGGSAIFLYSLGQGATGLSVYATEQPSFSIDVAPGGPPPPGVPEPGSLLLLAAGAVVLAGNRLFPLRR